MINIEQDKGGNSIRKKKKKKGLEIYNLVATPFVFIMDIGKY